MADYGVMAMWRAPLILAVLSLVVLTACGDDADPAPSAEGADSTAAVPSADCTIVDELFRQGPSTLEVVGSPEWFARQVRIVDLYRRLQATAPPDVGDDLATIVAAQEEYLAGIEPLVGSGDVDSEEISRRERDFNARSDLAGPGSAVAEFISESRAAC